MISPPPLERTLRTVILGVYVFMVAATAAVHEPWRDEADAWLVARDSGWSDFFEHGRYSGTPALWYLFQMPFAKAGLPYGTQKVLHTLVVSAAAFVLLHFSPFPLLMKGLLLSGYYLGYEYAVIARNYSLGNLILLSIAALWSPRRTFPLTVAILVALLANVSVHFGFFALIIGALVAVDLLKSPAQSEERRRRLSAIVLMMSGGLIGFLQMFPPADSWARPIAVTRDYDQIGQTIKASLFPLMDMTAAVYIAIAIYAAIVVVMIRSRAAILLITGAASLLYVVVFKWSGGVRHHGLLLIWLLFCVWIWIASGGSPRIARIVTAGFSVVFAASVIINARQFVREWRHPYSGSREMALYMKRHQLDRSFVAAHHPTRAGAVLAHLPKRVFYFPALGESGSYVRWDAKFMRNAGLDVATALERLERQRPAGRLLLLVDAPLPDDAPYRLLHTTSLPFGQPDERYWLYERQPAGVAGRDEPAS